MGHGIKVAVTYVREDKLQSYMDAVELAGLEPVPISPREPRGLDGLGGLVLTGGGDVDPARYGEVPRPETDHVMPERDALEDALIRDALARGLPVLAICRGLQILNVACGGTLAQHITGHRETTHTVLAEPASLTAVFIGSDDYAVNSRHHQAAERIGAGLAVTARAPDGVVEALEMPARRFVVAVQWHPEERVRDPGSRDLRLFRALAKVVR